MNNTLHLRELRNVLSEKQISQKDLSERAGLSRTTINKLFHGGSTSPRTAQKIAHAIGVPMTRLIGEEKPEPTPLRVLAGQSNVVEYPAGDDILLAVVEARLNHQGRELESMRESLKSIADSVEELATRPLSNPKKTTIVSEYE